MLSKWLYDFYANSCRCFMISTIVSITVGLIPGVLDRDDDTFVVLRGKLSQCLPFVLFSLISLSSNRWILEIPTSLFQGQRLLGQLLEPFIFQHCSRYRLEFSAGLSDVSRISLNYRTELEGLKNSLIYTALGFSIRLSQNRLSHDSTKLMSSYRVGILPSRNRCEGFILK